MKMPRIVWFRWAGPEDDFDRILVVGASTNQEARSIATADDFLTKALGDISGAVGVVWYDDYTYVEYDQAHWDEEDGIPEVDRWDVIVIGPEDLLFWLLLKDHLGDADLEASHIYQSQLPKLSKGQLREAVKSWIRSDPAAGKAFLAWADEAWSHHNHHVRPFTSDPELRARVEAAGIDSSIHCIDNVNKESGDGKVL